MHVYKSMFDQCWCQPFWGSRWTVPEMPFTQDLTSGGSDWPLLPSLQWTGFGKEERLWGVGADSSLWLPCQEKAVETHQRAPLFWSPHATLTWQVAVVRRWRGRAAVGAAGQAG